MAIDKTKKFADLAYEYVRKKLVKPSKGGITSLPTEKEITNEMLQMFEKLRGAGYNVTNIGKEVRNADDLGFLINRIEQAELDQSKQFLDSAEALETIQYKLNNNIPLNPDDQKKLLGKGFKTASEAFQGFTPKVIQGGKSEGIKSLDLAKELEELTNKNLKERGLGEIKLGDKLPEPKNKKPAVDPELQALTDQNEMFQDFSKRIKGMSSKDRVAERLKDLKGVDLFDLSGIEAQKIASEVIGRKGPFKTISNKGAKEVLGELDTIIKRADAEPDLGKKKMIKDFEERNERALEDFVDDAGGTKEGVEFDDEPFDAAKGGRALMFKGGISKLIQKFKGKTKDKKAGDKIYGVGGEEIDVADFKKSLGLDKATDKKGMEDLEKKLQMIIGKDRTKHNMGGRIGFEKGGMTRRTFLKLLGGLASIPLVGKFLKPAAKASKAVEVASKASGVPAYFPKLVEKIQLLGDDVSRTRATGERQIVKEYKGYELTEEMDTGKLTIKRDNYTSEEYLQFEPGGQYYDETRKKVIKYPDEYEEVTVKPDYEGKMKDVDYGLDNIDEILEEVGESKIKKSGGGLAYMMGE